MSHFSVCAFNGCFAGATAVMNCVMNSNEKWTESLWSPLLVVRVMFWSFRLAQALRKSAKLWSQFDIVAIARNYTSHDAQEPKNSDGEATIKDVQCNRKPSKGRSRDGSTQTENFSWNCLCILCPPDTQLWFQQKQVALPSVIPSLFVFCFGDFETTVDAISHRRRIIMV